MTKTSNSAALTILRDVAFFIGEFELKGPSLTRHANVPVVTRTAHGAPAAGEVSYEDNLYEDQKPDTRLRKIRGAHEKEIDYRKMEMLFT